MGILQARILEWGAIALSRGIFLTQGSNPGLPHCRQTLYRLSHICDPKGVYVYGGAKFKVKLIKFTF